MKPTSAPAGQSSPAPVPSNSAANATVARPVGSCFSPLDEQLGLTQEGFSPGVIRLAVRQGAKAAFAEASADLKALADVKISAMHLQRFCRRVGREWADHRDRDVVAFRAGKLTPTVATPPPVAAVMLDGGRVQTRASDARRGVHNRRWRETKVACCLTYAAPEKAVDPQPEPPAKLLQPVAVARLAAELKARRGSGPKPAARATPEAAARTRRRHPTPPRRTSRRRVRTVIASLAESETFGYQMAAEVQRRRLGEASRKACVCDGQKWNWTLFALHLLPWGFVGVLDVIHLVSYLYGAAHAAEATGGGVAWTTYEQWLRWAWAGEVGVLVAALTAAVARAGPAAEGAKEDDPRRVLAEALGYVKNNRTRMNYPDYRRQGLPISSAPVESVIKQLNRRIKGTEKFWEAEGVEAIVQLRAAYLSEDGRAEEYAARRRPRGRAVGAQRLTGKKKS
jgi:hypothetical protein